MEDSVVKADKHDQQQQLQRQRKFDKKEAFKNGTYFYDVSRQSTSKQDVCPVR